MAQAGFEFDWSWKIHQNQSNTHQLLHMPASGALANLVGSENTVGGLTVCISMHTVLQTIGNKDQELNKAPYTNCVVICRDLQLLLWEEVLAGAIEVVIVIIYCRKFTIFRKEIVEGVNSTIFLWLHITENLT